MFSDNEDSIPQNHFEYSLFLNDVRDFFRALNESYDVKIDDYQFNIDYIVYKEKEHYVSFMIYFEYCEIQFQDKIYTIINKDVHNITDYKKEVFYELKKYLGDNSLNRKIS
ncbi:MAG: hypothetical protein ACPG4Z_04095 [Chitinophagales bacterium]